MTPLDQAASASFRLTLDDPINLIVLALIVIGWALKGIGPISNAAIPPILAVLGPIFTVALTHPPTPVPEAILRGIVYSGAAVLLHAAVFRFVEGKIAALFGRVGDALRPDDPSDSPRTIQLPPNPTKNPTSTGEPK